MVEIQLYGMNCNILLSSLNLCKLLCYQCLIQLFFSHYVITDLCINYLNRGVVVVLCEMSIKEFDLRMFKLKSNWFSDHETRHNNLNRAEDHSPSPREETPLLHRFPEGHDPERSLFMTVSVSLLLITLITGVIIGVYLLILQSNSENILPPIETPLQLVSRKQWDHTDSQPVLSLSPLKAKQVIVIQTDTSQCMNTYTCSKLLQSLQMNTTSADKLLPYNFLVSTNGQTYEALGWHRPSPLFPEYPDSLVLAFIGNFTEQLPSKVQIDEAKNFFAESVSQQHLEPTYIIFGKSSAFDPKYLFSSLKNLPQWDSDLSDL